MNVWLIAGAWTVGSFLTALVSLRLSLLIIIVEMFVGMTGGDFFSQTGLKWVGLFASIITAILAFLVTSRIDIRKVVTRWEERFSPSGKFVFAVFLGGWAFAFWLGLSVLQKRI